MYTILYSPIMQSAKKGVLSKKRIIVNVFICKILSISYECAPWLDNKPQSVLTIIPTFQTLDSASVFVNQKVN